MISSQTVQIIIATVLANVVVGSGIWVVLAKHESRQLFAEIEELKREQDRLQIDWGRLRLEQSAWATHSRIETLARERMNLAPPTDQRVVIIAERGP